MKKRIFFSSVFVLLFMISLLSRIGYIIFSKSYTVSDTYNSYTITLDTLEPNIYYSNYTRLTNNVYKKYALLKPNAKTLAELPKLFDNTEEIISELRQGKPVLKEVENVKTDYINILNVRESENNCSQLLSAQSSGLLKYLPISVGERKLRFFVDAKGRMLTGDEGEIVDNNYVSSEGLLLYLDENIQKITFNACKSIKSGCAIVMDVENSEILACVTKPETSYINKPFTLYSVGSVFKLIIAACALENGVNLKYECGGKIRVSDTVYSCQKEHKHGLQNLEEALSNSCNCYFVNLAMNLGAEKILETAHKFGFGEYINIYSDWKVKGSELPTEFELKYYGELPLIGFGQGKLLVTPLQVCSALCTIANGGYKNDIKLVKSEIDKFGKRKDLDYQKSNKVLSGRSAYLLLKYMRSVVENGTGNNADYKKSSAGKTATAQTGQYNNGEEILNTWFAGVYPYNNPKYAVVILKEDGKSGAEDCCPVFRTIVENLE